MRTTPTNTEDRGGREPAASPPSLDVGSLPAIKSLDLAKRYGKTTALAGLTMTVPRGEVFGFLGPNGAGKTTAVKLLVGLILATSGEAWMLGEPVGDRETRRRVGYLPELFRYQEWLTAREVLDLHCELTQLPRSGRSQEIAEILETVGLYERADDRVGTFSKGMQQRLGLGVALIGRPELVLLDEPTSALDPVGRHDVREIIRDLKKRGTSVFLNSHLLNEVEQVCDRVAVVDRGRVIAMGSMDDLRGGQNSVRLRVGNVRQDGETLLRRYGELDLEGEWYRIRGIEPDDVPALVTALVRLDVRVYAVEPERITLEDRFIQLLGGGVDGDPDHRATYSA